MLPQSSIDLSQGIVFQDQPSLTWSADPVTNRLRGRGDNYEAIRQAVLSCETPSLLLITGKGAETRQKRGLEYIDTPSDVEYVQAFLREWDAKKGRAAHDGSAT